MSELVLRAVFLYQFLIELRPFLIVVDLTESIKSFLFEILHFLLDTDF